MYGGNRGRKWRHRHRVRRDGAIPYSQGLFPGARPHLGGAKKETRSPDHCGNGFPKLADIPAGFAPSSIDVRSPKDVAGIRFPAPVLVNARHTVRCLRTGTSPAMTNRIEAMHL